MAVSFGLATFLIALMFKYLPDAEIEWRDTWLGAFITALLFIVGKAAIGLYLGQASVASSFGAAGSVVVFMIWVYYASLIILFGAEITHAVAEHRGAHTPPMDHAHARSEGSPPVNLKNIDWRAKLRPLYEWGKKVPPVLRSLLGLLADRLRCARLPANLGLLDGAARRAVHRARCAALAPTCRTLARQSEETTSVA